MTHDFPESDLTAFVLGELDAESAARVAKAAAADPALFAEIEEIRSAVGLVAAVLATTPSDARRPVLRVADDSPVAPPRGLRRAAAAATFVVLATGLGYVATRPASRASRSAAERGTESPAAVRGSEMASSAPTLWFDMGLSEGLMARANPSDESKKAATYALKRLDELSAVASSKADGAPSVGLTLLTTAAALQGAAARPEGVPAETLRRGLRDGLQDEAPSGETYELPPENPFIKVVGKAALSTFATDVDTASYAVVRRFLNGGSAPPPAAVRLEELVNAFRYDVKPPADGEPLVLRAEIGPCPWAPKRKLLRVALKAKEIDFAKRPPSNLVFLVDVSGSMDQPNKLPLVVRSLKLLADQLGENDKLSVVVYAGAAGTALAPTRGDRRAEIREALDRLKAGGSTAGGAGIALAYRLAREQFIPGGVNRVILCTDGDFNVGVTNKDDLVRLVEEKAKDGVFLTALGFGMGNLKDATLEQIADKGNGNYGYVDDDREARRLLVEGASGTLLTVAKDVKVQVEFNPSKVAAYRLLGYENRALAAQDFRNDAKDAGEVGAGHVVTALYELVPAGSEEPLAAAEPPLKYQAAPQAPAAPAPAKPQDIVIRIDPGALTPEWLTASVRYKAPDGDVATERSLAVSEVADRLGDASDDFRFAATVAMFGMELRRSPHRGGTTWALIEEFAVEAAAREARRTDRPGTTERAEFLDLVRKARALP